jgi:hypothetical protein
MKETRAFKQLKKHHPDAHWQRIETWAGSGVLDVNACKGRVEVWFELKQFKLPKNGVIKLQRTKSVIAQIAWMVARAKAGGRIYYAIMVDTHFHIIPWYLNERLLQGIKYEGLKAYEVNPEIIFNV